jgi:hypothetical protein
MMAERHRAMVLPMSVVVEGVRDQWVAQQTDLEIQQEMGVQEFPRQFRDLACRMPAEEAGVQITVLEQWQELLPQAEETVLEMTRAEQRPLQTLVEVVAGVGIPLIWRTVTVAPASSSCAISRRSKRP